MAAQATEIATNAPWVDADFAIGGPKDYDHFFRYLHDLLVREGSSTEYGVVCTSLQLAGVESARKTPERVARDFREGGAILDLLALPDLNDPKHKAQAGSTGVRLSSPSLPWLRAETARWLAAGGPAEAATFTTSRDIDAPPRLYPRILRLVSWLQSAVGGATAGARLEVSWDAQPRGTLAETLAGNVVACPSCRRGHAAWPCSTVVRAARPARLKTVSLGSGRALARVTAADGPDAPSLWLQAPDVDALERALGEWPKLVATPWDLDPAKLAALPRPTVRVEEDPAVPGVRDRRSVASLEIAAYPQPSYFLLWKAIHWLSTNAPGAKAIVALLSDPDERVLVEIAGEPASCSLCGSQHPPSLCEKVSLQVAPERLLSLGAVSASGTELTLRPRERQVRALASDRAAASAPVEAWAKIERTVWDVP